MEMNIAFGKDGISVDGVDDDGTVFSDLGKPGFNRILGAISERRKKRFAALDKAFVSLSRVIREDAE